MMLPLPQCACDATSNEISRPVANSLACIGEVFGCGIFSGRHMYLPELIVDEADQDLLLRFNWQRIGRGYFGWRPWDPIKKKQATKFIILHRVILERKIGRPLRHGEQCDHADRNKANNQRSNLRVVTHWQNAQNKSPQMGKRFRGVHFHKRDKKWVASVRFNYKLYSCGYHTTPELAAAAAAEKRKALGFFGE